MIILEREVMRKLKMLLRAYWLKDPINKVLRYPILIKQNQLSLVRHLLISIKSKHLNYTLGTSMPKLNLEIFKDSILKRLSTIQYQVRIWSLMLSIFRDHGKTIRT